MTTAISNIANILALTAPGSALSLTTYPYDYHAGPFNPSLLAPTLIAHLNTQDYTFWYSAKPSGCNDQYPVFIDEVTYMLGQVGSQYTAKVEIGMADYHDCPSSNPCCNACNDKPTCVNPPKAGYCLSGCLANSIQSHPDCNGYDGTDLLTPSTLPAPPQNAPIFVNYLNMMCSFLPTSKIGIAMMSLPTANNPIASSCASAMKTYGMTNLAVWPGSNHDYPNCDGKGQYYFLDPCSLQNGGTWYQVLSNFLS